MHRTFISVLSGGLDSTVATALSMREGKVALALTFDYGQRAIKQEMKAAQFFCSRNNIEHRVIELPWLAVITKTALVNREQEIPKVNLQDFTPPPTPLPRGEGEWGRVSTKFQKSATAVWVPNRNGIFLAIAAAYAECTKAEGIVVGFNAEEAVTFPDNSKEFVDAYNVGLTFSTQHKVEIISPTIAMNKVEIMKKAIELDIDLNKLWSCYEGGEKPCGTCESCARTKRAIEAIR